MHKYDELRKQIRRLRINGATYNELKKKYNVSKSMLNYWLSDIPINEKIIARRDKNTKMGRDKNHLRSKQNHQAAFQDGLAQAKTILSTPNLRDVVVIFMCEGANKSKCGISITNTNSNILRCTKSALKIIAPNKQIHCKVNIHLDVAKNDARKFWSDTLNIDAQDISVYYEKKNGGKFSRRGNRLLHGTCTLSVFDTYLRDRMEAWKETLYAEWSA